LQPDEPTPPPPEPPIPEPQSNARRARGCLLELLETVVLTVLIFLGVQTFVAQPYRVEGESMATTLEPDQYVLIDKLTPRWSPYERGDIVVLDPPEGAAQGASPFIKRVIALAGDRVELRDGDVYVNGTKLDEPYVFAEDDGQPQDTDPLPPGGSEWTVPDGSVFVLGDHRGSSSDSRVFGPIEVAHVLGRAWLRYWPINAFGPLQTPEIAADAGG
jgi:signal peptidase I